MDELELHEPFSMGDFAVLSRQRAAEIIARGNTPIVVGGTGFYISGFLFGPSGAPRRDSKVHDQLVEQVSKDASWATR